MDKEQTIEKLWEASNHGARREDIEAAYSAGVTAAESAAAADRDLLRDALAALVTVAEADADSMPAAHWHALESARQALADVARLATKGRR